MDRFRTDYCQDILELYEQLKIHKELFPIEIILEKTTIETSQHNWNGNKN